MCEKMNVPFLGSLPLDPRLGQACDKGDSFIQACPESPAAQAYVRLAESIRIQVDTETSEGR